MQRLSFATGLSIQRWRKLFDCFVCVFLYYNFDNTLKPSMSTMEIFENGRTYHSLPGMAFHVHYINFRDWSDIPFKHYQGVTICAWHVNSHERSDIPSDDCLSGARSSSPQLMLSDKHNSRVKLDFFTNQRQACVFTKKSIKSLHN